MTMTTKEKSELWIAIKEYGRAVLDASYTLGTLNEEIYHLVEVRTLGKIKQLLDIN